MAFDWIRQRGGYGGEGALRRKEAGMTVAELAEKSRPMAEEFRRKAGLVDSIRRRLPELIDGTDEARIEISKEIIRDNPGALPDHVDDPKEVAALILEIARITDREDRVRRQRSH